MSSELGSEARDIALAHRHGLGYHCGMRLHSFLLLGLCSLLPAPVTASGDCDPRQALAFSDGSRVCLHDRPSLPLPANRQSWRPAFNAMYSVAASLDSACPVALGVGTNINSPLAWYAERRDQQALEQCQSELRRMAAPAACRCEMLVKDGSALIERSDFDAWVARTLPASAPSLFAAATQAEPARAPVESLPPTPTAAPHLTPHLPPHLPPPQPSSTPSATTSAPGPAGAGKAEAGPPRPETASSAPATAPAPTTAASQPRTFVTPVVQPPVLQAARLDAPQRPALAGTPAAVSASAPVVAAALPPALPPSAPRRALVVGNRDYVVGRLKNPVNDARAMAAQLRGLQFQTTLVENLRRDDIGRVVDGFLASVQPGDDVLLFYAGHGLQIRGANYLPAVDAVIRGESDVPLNSIHLNVLLERLDEARAGVRLLLIDACRDNPYARSYRSGAVGLARIDAAPAGTLIHFATRPGGVSADGDGEHGLYTKHLLQHLGTPELPVEQMLKRVASAVRRESGNAQLPWTEGSLDGDFYFVPPPPRSR